MGESISPKMSIIGVISWAIAVTFFMYEFFLRTVTGTFSQNIMHDLGLTGHHFALVASAYYMAYGLMQIPVGLLVDRFGVKSLMVVATMACSVSCYLFAYSNGFFLAALSRVLMGAGSSFAFVCLLVLASMHFPRRMFGFMVGLSQFIGTMGPLLSAGPLHFYLQVQHETWHDALKLMGEIGVALAFLSLFFIKAQNEQDKKVILIERKIPVKQRMKMLFSNTQAIYVALFTMLVYGSISLLGASWGVSYLKACMLSASNAACVMSMAWLGFAISCPLVGMCSDWAKKRKMFLVGLALLGFVSTFILLAFKGFSLFGYELLFFVLGVASSGQSLSFAVMSEHTCSKVRATALGFNNAAVMMFSALLPVSTGYILDQVSQGHAIAASLIAFNTALSVMPILFGLAVCIALFLIKETFGRPQRDPTIIVAPLGANSAA